MKQGDLVNFFCNSWVFSHAHDRYKNPGIILDEINHNRTGGQPSYRVLWADKKITCEHKCYLKEV